MAKTLHGVRVLDLTHILSGPYGAMILADLGAETIKVEPLGGEGTRKLLATDPRHSVDGMGAYFITLNRNKQSVCIDLKCERGLQLFYDLVKESDVVINNYSAGVPVPGELVIRTSSQSVRLTPKNPESTWRHRRQPVAKPPTPTPSTTSPARRVRQVRRV